MNEVFKMNERRTCACCGIVLDSIDDYYVVDDDVYCEDCFVDNFETCEDCGAIIPKDEAHWIEGYEHYVCDDCYEEYSVCANCGALERRNNMYNSVDGAICEYCRDYHYTTCDDCGARVHNDYIRYDEETYKPAGLDLIALNLPIFKDKTGKRPMLERNKMLNPDKLVTLLNIKASIDIQLPSGEDISDYYYNLQSGYNSDSTLINTGQYESTVAIIPQWNMQFLTSDFWKHGQAGIIDIADDIKPTIWYGKQHPFEFEVVVINDPAVHKIFTNLEIVANKAKPESFHYEVIGETYDFAKDKPNMYFRQEALKALWQYNGADISYNRNFLKIEPKKQSKSADLIRKYYSRQDTINEIEDYYLSITQSTNHDYRHLSGGEIVYYPNRQEYRIQNHVKAVDIADLDQDNPRSIISANCQYLEDKWNVTINPLLVCYKNEESWAKAYNNSSKLPVLPIYNSPVPDKILEKNNIEFPDKEGNALYNLYDLSNFGKDGNWKPLDLTNWLDDNNFGESWNRKEVDIRDKFIKIRIRYSGEELAIIDFLKTIYQVSYA